MKTTDVDVVVIGAGFAGLTAARELTRQGLTVRIVEARDRIGGRTWLDRRLGTDLEIGGTWVHWTQPYIWAELKRYGLATTSSPQPRKAMWWAEGSRHEGDPEELLNLIGSSNEKFVQEARHYFPEPFRPLGTDAFREIDDITVVDRIRSEFPPGASREILESFWALNFNGPLDEAAYTQALRWVALTNGDWAVSFEACATYKIMGGTGVLAQAMLNDTSADVDFGFTVAEIRDDDGVVTVSDRNGRAVTAATAIVTLPLAVLHSVAFHPDLPAVKQEAVERGQVSKGTKVWVRLRGLHEPFVALGGAEWPLNFVQSEYEVDGDTVIVAFGPDAGRIDSADASAVEFQLRRLLPAAEVLDVATHDWTADEYSGETWPMHKAGFLSRHLAGMQKPHGRVLFAGSDIANGWGGFIDGAIESGMEAAHEAGILLQAVEEPVAAGHSHSPEHGLNQTVTASAQQS